MKHAWLCLDPGITTGWAVLGDDGKLLATSVWGTHELRASLDALVRLLYTAGYGLTAVVEAMPPGSYGELGRKLEHVRSEIKYVLEETYEVRVVRVAPGTWKTSRAARTWTPVWRFNKTPTTVHQRDAIRMGLYVIDRDGPPKEAGYEVGLGTHS